MATAIIFYGGNDTWVGWWVCTRINCSVCLYKCACQHVNKSNSNLNKEYRAELMKPTFLLH